MLVTLKLQRPLSTNGSDQEIMSYIVDDDDEKLSNPFIQPMRKRDIKKLFGDHYKVYYLGEYTEGKPVNLLVNHPVRKDEWV